MRFSTYFLFLLICLPAIVSGQDKLVLKEISFVFDYKDVSGTVGDFRSTSRVDIDKPENAFFEGSVAVQTLKTGNFLRDWAIRGRKYFNEEQYPRIFFKSIRVTGTSEGLKATGLLTMKGTTNSLLIHFKRTKEGLIGQAELYTSDYGIAIKKKREENKVTITMAFELK